MTKAPPTTQTRACLEHRDLCHCVVLVNTLLNITAALSRPGRCSHFGGGSRTFSPPSAPPHVIRRPLGFRSKQQREHTRLLLLVRCLTRKPLHHLSRRRLPVHFGERGHSRELVRTIAAGLRQQALASAFILALPVAFIPQS